MICILSFSSRAASSAGSAAHANPSEVPPIAKRPRMEMGGPIHHQGSHVSQPPPLHGQPSSQHASHIQSTSAITPLRIDTREAAKVKYKSIIFNVTNVIFRINLSLKQGCSFLVFFYRRTRVIIQKSRLSHQQDLKQLEEIVMITSGRQKMILYKRSRKLASILSPSR